MPANIDPNNEQTAVKNVPHYAPRYRPMEIPVENWDDDPLYCLRVNSEWAGHIIGALNTLDQPDAWIGDAEEIWLARQQVNQIIAQLMERCDPMSNCCPEPLQRVLEDGTLQVSYDNGMTWADATTEDPRKTAPQLPPISGDDGDVKRCNAANNVLGQFKDGIATFEGYFDTTNTVVAFVTAVAGFIVAVIFSPFAVPIVVGAIIALMSAVYAVGKAAYVAAFDDTVFGDLLCILYCHCEDDGTYTSADFAAIRADISAHFGSIAADAFLALLNGVTVSGLNTMARIPTGSTVSCDSCTDCPDCTVTPFWATGAGTIEHIEGCTYRFTSIPEDSHHAIYIWIDNDSMTYDASKCGKIIASTPISGAVTLQGYNECDTGTLHFPVLDVSNICASQFYFQCSEETVIEFTFDAC